MNRQEKQQAVNSLGEQFRAINSAFLVNYTGLKVNDATYLRRRIREIDGKYFVVKNRLAMRAAQDTNLAPLVEHLVGPTAVVYHPKDVVALAKVLTDIGKTNPNIVFKAAIVEGKVVPADEIHTLASMPAREVLLSKLAFLLKAPLQRLATVLKAPVRDLALVVKQIEK